MEQPFFYLNKHDMSHSRIINFLLRFKFVRFKVKKHFFLIFAKTMQKQQKANRNERCGMRKESRSKGLVFSSILKRSPSLLN